MTRLNVTPARFSAKTITTVALIIAGLVVVGMTSCKGSEDCGAYQGSKRSGTRSYKHKKSHRHAMVVDSKQATRLG